MDASKSAAGGVSAAKLGCSAQLCACHALARRVRIHALQMMKIMSESMFIITLVFKPSTLSNENVVSKVFELNLGMITCP